MTVEIGSKIRAKFRSCFPHNSDPKPYWYHTKGNHSFYLVCACSSRGRPLNAIPTILAELKARKKKASSAWWKLLIWWQNARKLGFASNDRVSRKLMAVTGLASLNCKATAGRHIHGTAGTPLGAVALGAKRKSKRCEVCTQKEGSTREICSQTEEPTHPDVDLRLSCVSANTLLHDLHEKEVNIVFDTLFLSLSMNLSARCAFKASQGEVRGETSFHIS